MSCLTISYRRAEMIGFWIIAVLLLSLAVALTTWLVGVDRPVAWAAGACAAALLPRVVSDRWFATGVRVWNGIVRRTAAVLRVYVVAVCYYTLFTALGLKASGRRAQHPRTGSWWLARETHSLRVRPHTAEDRGLAASAGRLGNAWMLWLAPVVFLLEVLGDDHVRTAPPASTYTLY
jgi:hypothetical protein